MFKLPIRFLVLFMKRVLRFVESQQLWILLLVPVSGFISSLVAGNFSLEALRTRTWASLIGYIFAGSLLLIGLIVAAAKDLRNELNIEAAKSRSEAIVPEFREGLPIKVSVWPSLLMGGLFSAAVVAFIWFAWMKAYPSLIPHPPLESIIKAQLPKSPRVSSTNSYRPHPETARQGIRKRVIPNRDALSTGAPSIVLPRTCQLSQSPRLHAGNDEFCEFDNVHLVRWGNDLIAKLVNLTNDYQNETRDLSHNPQETFPGGFDMNRIVPNGKLQQAYMNCCYPQVLKYRNEVASRLTGGADNPSYALHFYDKANPHFWAHKDIHVYDLIDIEQDLRGVTDQLAGETKQKP